MSDKSALELLALEMLKEKKRKRRFSLVKWIGLAAVLAFLFINVDKTKTPKKDHVAVIEVNGPIFEGALASSDNMHKSLLRVVKAKGAKALFIKINSPGGSPVEADLMYQDILRFKKKHQDIPVFAICMDTCASAAYYIASSADEIFANPSSLVGSIGVIYNGFGFTDLINRIGIERRLITAGKDKGFLDPFSKENPEQVKELKTMLNIVHQQFIDSVLATRKNKLKKSDTLFTGRIWTGVQAKSLGLIDDFGSVWTVMSEKTKQKQLIDYTYKEGITEKLMREFSTELTQSFFHQLQKQGFS